jgi:hypothetical protein
MSIVAERHLDLASLQTAWRGRQRLPTPRANHG